MNICFVGSVLGLALLFTSCASNPKNSSPKISNCIEILGALDVGSGATKLMAARVDQCSQTILEVLIAPERIKVPYREGFTQKTRQDGMKVFKSIRARFDALGVTQTKGVATAAFRADSGAINFLKEVEQETGFEVTIVTQEQEALLGVASVAAKMGVDPRAFYIWDVGAGSQQITAFLTQSEREKLSIEAPHLVFGNEMASDSGRELALELQPNKKSADFEVGSPNPLGRANLIQLVRQLKSKALKEITGHPLLRLITAPHTPNQQRRRWIGIGGVLGNSVCELLKQSDKSGGCLIKVEALWSALLIASEHSDRRLVSQGFSAGPQFVRSAVSNGALILAYMQALKIDQVQSVSLDLTYGLLAGWRP